MDLAKHLLLGCTDTQNLTLFPTISFWKSLGLAQNEFGYTEQIVVLFSCFKRNSLLHSTFASTTRLLHKCVTF